MPITACVRACMCMHASLCNTMHGTIIPGALCAPGIIKVHDIVLLTSYYVERINVKRNTHIQNQSITVDFIIVASITSISMLL